MGNPPKLPKNAFEGLSPMVQGPLDAALQGAAGTDDAGSCSAVPDTKSSIYDFLCGEGAEEAGSNSPDAVFGPPSTIIPEADDAGAIGAPPGEDAIGVPVIPEEAGLVGISDALPKRGPLAAAGTVLDTAPGIFRPLAEEPAQPYVRDDSAVARDDLSSPGLPPGCIKANAPAPARRSRLSFLRRGPAPPDAPARADAPEEPVAPKRSRLSFLRRNKAPQARPAAVLEEENETGTGSATRPGLFGKIRGLFSEPEMAPISSLHFDPGMLGEPSTEGALCNVDVTYRVDEPFQYVRIAYNRDERALRYHVLEPPLSPGEAETLRIIRGAFEKMISTSVDLILGGHREAYLHERFDTILKIFGFTMSGEQRERIFFHLKRDYLGYGRIDTLMKDKYIEDVSCNGAEMELYVQHRTYGPVRTHIQFGDVELNNFVLKLAQISGRHISLLQPIRDVTLPDGSRGNLTLGSEVTRHGSTFTIRKFRANPISAIELMDYGTIDAQQLAFLWLLMEYKRSLLVSGGTASGKTTFLNVLCSFIPTDYKIVSIEDTAEMNLMHPNWVQSVTRTGFGSKESVQSSASGVSGISSKSAGEICLYDLLVAALRQRPEYIIVGEVRGPEAFTLFQAIAVGHAAMGTIHAGSMDELLARIESNPMNVPRSLFSNIDAVVFPLQIRKGERNVRRIMQIVELLELDRESGDLVTNTVFRWDAEKDEFWFSGKSYLFDGIRDAFGVSRELLVRELRDRTNLLTWIQSRCVRDYSEILTIIRMYNRDKDEVQMLMELSEQEIRAYLMDLANKKNGDEPAEGP
ncbi:MAG: type II/IV secretion system ATPase subunit [Methanomicrobiaceae archaeon]|nr:type II/IV secretion system ATPase subunit [Methanomicrobiaceae archaeon]